MLALLAEPLFAQMRGYVERPCGFDMDDDGVVGELADDCNVCDGTTTDPDGDAVSEDLIYVDSVTGTDTGGCGTPGSPCLTLGYALGTVADGPGDGAEDIICFRGTFSPSSQVPGTSGLVSTKVQTATGSENQNWLLPDNPAMIVGWDSDNDGEYPPYDADDTAVLDGTGLDWALDWETGGPDGDYFELAHFTAQEYGRDDPSVGGFYRMQRPHNYVHDLSLININRETVSDSERIVFRAFSMEAADYFLVENIECLDCGGFFTRGTAGNGPGEGGPYRFKNVHWTSHPCGDGDPGCPSGGEPDQIYGTFLKWWGYNTGLEVIDSILDGAPENRTIGTHTAEHPNGVNLSQCTQGAWVVNNEFINVRAAFQCQGFATGACDGAAAREVTGTFTRNLIRFSTTKFNGDLSVLTDGGDSAGEHCGDITITNNVFRAEGSGQWHSCLQDQSSNIPADRELVFAGNTCIGDPGGSNGAGVILLSSSGYATVTLRGNLFAGSTAAQNLRINHAPGSWSSDGNAFDSDAGYRWVSTDYSDLSSFRSASGGDAASAECVPTFAGDGYHLAAGDICAKDAGLDLTAITAVDYDGDTRSAVTPDIGADEVAAGSGPLCCG